VRQRDGLVQVDRVLEQALDELDVVVGRWQPVTCERVGDLGQQVVPVAVVGLATDPPGRTDGDRRVTLVDVRTVPLAGRPVLFASRFSQASGQTPA
jgi:hypothetical protein